MIRFRQAFHHAVRLATAPLVLVLLLAAPDAPAGDVSRYDVVWTAPSEGADGSMPLGNGDISANAWIEPGGDLLLSIGKTDSWDAHGRLLKVGRVRVTLDPPLPVRPFEQRLALAEGAMVVRSGGPRERVEMRVWVDANEPVVRVEIESVTERAAAASVELWRTIPEPIPSAEVSDLFFGRLEPGPLGRTVTTEPDVLIDPLPRRIGWYHATSEGPLAQEVIDSQGLGPCFEGVPHPLAGRVFGAIVTGAGAERLDAATLRAGPARRHGFDIAVLTLHPATPGEWLGAAERLAARVGSSERARGAHGRWWRDFWERSWIDVTTPDGQGPDLVPASAHPVRIGADQQGENRFVGEIGRVTILQRAAGPEEVRRWSASTRRSDLRGIEGALFAGEAGPGGALGGSEAWEFSRGLTIEAWVRPGTLAPGGGRIADRITPGGSDGWLLDTHPGRSLRFMVGRAAVGAEAALAPNEWSHVAAVADPASGRIAVYLNGEPLAERKLEVSDDGLVVSRGYALQRYVNACAGRGRYPIKFNGSIFTVPHEGAFGDADYRRWGPGYWWQNTRLPHLGMCAGGDFDLMEPLFRMYVDEMSPLNRFRTRLYTGHGGLFIPECVLHWGPIFPETYGWTPVGDREDKLQESRWHKWEWVSGPELAWMMLDYYDHTLDGAFLRERLLPFATDVLRFFDEHYGRDASGTLLMEPSQALETWWDTTNPMPEVAGLRAVAARLLALPPDLTGASDRELWSRVADSLPPLPTRTVEGVEMLAPAARFERKSNIENPELYAVFPFRLVSFEKENAPLGVAALHARWDRGSSGWRQDDLFMTHLGLAEEARANLVSRARSKHEGSRFPAFWGPNYDWVPDQDHGGVLIRTLQTMLMQTEGRTIYLLPAWPDGWDAEFKLHAPQRTTVCGRVEAGRIVDLSVEPPSRRADVVVCDR